jgi:hypothetical protein
MMKDIVSRIAPEIAQYATTGYVGIVEVDILVYFAHSYAQDVKMVHVRNPMESVSIVGGFLCLRLQISVLIIIL